MRNKSWKTLSLVIETLTPAYLTSFNFEKHAVISWKDMYLLLNHMSIVDRRPCLHSMPRGQKMLFDRRVTEVGKHVDVFWWLVHALMRNINTVEPLFSFYIYKVDKKIFKNTRGKSGKFTFIWKYVTKYKRSNLVMFWLMKELRMNPGRTMYDRLLAVLRTIIFEPKTSWIYRVRRFSYNYVYFNCRKTLGETYRTVTR